jgi:hypothetical protein
MTSVSRAWRRTALFWLAIALGLVSCNVRFEWPWSKKPPCPGSETLLRAVPESIQWVRHRGNAGLLLLAMRGAEWRPLAADGHIGTASVAQPNDAVPVEFELGTPYLAVPK